MEQEKYLQCKKVYEDFCKYLDQKGIIYEGHLDELRLKYVMKGTGLDLNMIVYVNTDFCTLNFLSLLPFSVKQEYAEELSSSLTKINYTLQFGCFAYDLTRQSVSYKICTPFEDSLIGNGLFDVLFHISLSTVQDYSDKLYLISHGYAAATDVE